jgi:hypothetical protein
MNEILTKENLLKRVCKKVELCEFGDDRETQEHLFFSCPLEKYIWSAVSVSLNINSNSFGFWGLYHNWFDTSAGRERKAIIIGSIAVIWAVWKTRNKSCFQRIRPGDPTNVILVPFHQHLGKNAEKRCAEVTSAWS